jgi:hypothetical protein
MQFFGKPKGCHSGIFHPSIQTKLGSKPVNPVVICPVPVVPYFALDIKKDENKHGNAQRQSGYVEESVSALPEQNAKTRYDEFTQHFVLLPGFRPV